MTVALDREIIYPDSDGQPMADNTEQFEWIVLLKENLECLFAQNPDVFVGGDLLWYPVEGHPEIRVAPDVMVALGRPKGKRGSYRQWQENNQPPQVVFEILSPGNTLKEMTKKLKFYDHHGVEEYYIYDPDDNELTGLQRIDGELTIIEEMANWASPLLGIKFELTADTLRVYYPDGRLFLSTVELATQAEQASQRADQEAQRAEREKLRAELAEAENDRLKALLAEAGIDV
ncbi:Uma2 family endonuclease [Synechocystis sp. PCC 7339]|uniref:Uma2 family endonuclease n=1 Tax=unclassified Synechocystis TaxID=2640012 RepID=UPI001BAF4253|nr:MULTISPECIES: Uma2 family endonuclease [unclassified Synechocystis]QUS59338.1 Uma2 family endonuclease [Synechocystis sp. PCC 7338]UAJ71524.1 Uma2 family endonuclease [Synechocystis sp. PCC 7339]